MKIFLIGMMGSGKSHWARYLSSQLGIPAYDLDTYIEEKESLTIAALFETRGESEFRKLEALYLREFDQVHNVIVATGGGTPCFFQNMDWMNSQGISIWLDETPEVLASRLQKEMDHRPLLKGLSLEELVSFLRSKIKERSVFYEKSTYRLKGYEINTDKILELCTNNLTYE